MTTSDEPIVVIGPAKAETVALLRSVAASVAARRDMDIAAIEEFRIAVDEAATLLLLGGKASRLEMSLASTPTSGVRVRVRTDVDGSSLNVDRATSWPWRVIRQLTHEAELSVDDAGAQVTFLVGEGSGA
jgi:serine/threonine-protein kinase RsbW